MINQKLKGIAHFKELIALHTAQGLYNLEPVSVAEIRLKHANGVEETKYYALGYPIEKISGRYAQVLLRGHRCSEDCYMKN